MTMPTSIGIAEMDDHRILYLTLEVRSPYGIGRSSLTYRPSDPEYGSVIAHLGGIGPGEKKSVPPWPDPKPGDGR